MKLRDKHGTPIEFVGTTVVIDDEMVARFMAVNPKIYQIKTDNFKYLNAEDARSFLDTVINKAPPERLTPPETEASAQMLREGADMARKMGLVANAEDFVARIWRVMDHVRAKQTSRQDIQEPRTSGFVPVPPGIKLVSIYDEGVRHQRKTDADGGLFSRQAAQLTPRFHRRRADFPNDPPRVEDPYSLQPGGFRLHYRSSDCDARGLLTKAKHCHRRKGDDVQPSPSIANPSGGFLHARKGDPGKTVGSMHKHLREDKAPTAVWADSVAVGFPTGRTDNLIALHLGASYTYLTADEARRLCEQLSALAKIGSPRSRDHYQGMPARSFCTKFGDMG